MDLLQPPRCLLDRVSTL